MYELDKVPEGDRARELWLQHAAGLIIFKDARQYAIDQINDDIDIETKDKVIEGINNAVYGLMMIFDGVTGSLSNSNNQVVIESIVKLINKSTENDETITSVNLMEGDGMCLGFHGWFEGDFGSDPVIKK